MRQAVLRSNQVIEPYHVLSLLSVWVGHLVFIFLPWFSSYAVYLTFCDDALPLCALLHSFDRKLFPIFIVFVYDHSRCLDSIRTGNRMVGEARKGLLPIGHKHNVEITENNRMDETDLVHFA